MAVLEWVGALTFAMLAPFGGDGGKWSYDQTGPAYWGSLDSSFSECGEGKNQSPIDLTNGTAKSLEPLVFDYKPSPLEVVNNGHTIQVNFQPGSRLKVDGQVFELAQFHLHTPSEHTLDGSYFPMELHLVHVQKGTENLAVVGVFMQEAAQAHPLMNLLWDQLPASESVTIRSSVEMNPAELLPADRAHFRYLGSLTTPPCSEGVRWHVIKAPIGITREQVDLFKALVGPNSRPVQPLGQRQLIMSR